MIISLCGNKKNVFLEELMKYYSKNVVICDLFNIKFRTVIENENIKYNFIEFSRTLEEARAKFSKYIDDKVNDKISYIIENNKNKIIVLVTSNNDLMEDVDKTKYFCLSDLKILIKLDNKCEYKYNFDQFDYVLNNKEDLDIRKLVKLC